MGLLNKIKNMFKQPEQNLVPLEEKNAEQNSVPLEQKEEVERNSVPFEEEKIEPNLSSHESENYKIFSEYDSSDPYTFQEKTGWHLAWTSFYDGFSDHIDNRCMVFKEVNDLPERFRERAVFSMAERILKYQELAEVPEEKRINVKEAEIEQIQEADKTADAWFKDYNKGWICDSNGKLQAISQREAEKIAEEEELLDIPLEERIVVGEKGSLALKEGVTKEQYFSVRSAMREYSLDYTFFPICEEIKSGDFKATDSLIDNINKFERLERKHYTLRELADLSRSKPDFNGNLKKQECFQSIIKEFQEQELEKMEQIKEMPHFLKQEMLEELALLPNA